MKNSVLAPKTFLRLGVCVALFASAARGLPNPAAVYAEKMGCGYAIEKNSDGSEHGVCILPDGSRVDEWAFLKGKVGRQFSYCAKKGYAVTTDRIDLGGGAAEECAVCTRLTANGAQDRIVMTKLMERNHEPLLGKAIPDTPPYQPAQRQGGAAPLAEGFDLRNVSGKNFINPIRNQGDCGCCYAFGAVAAAEGAWNWLMYLYGANRQSLSESFIMWCIGRVPEYDPHIYGCDGSDFTYPEMHGLVTHGACPLASFPYTTVDPGQCTHWMDPRFSFSGTAVATCNNVDAIKLAIQTWGTVEVSVLVSQAWHDYGGGYVYSDNNTICDGNPCDQSTTDHTVALVGWGYDAGGDYWILRNSWGTTWGESGYMRTRTAAARVGCAVYFLQSSPALHRSTAAISVGTCKVRGGGTGVNLVSGTSITANAPFDMGGQPPPATMNWSIQPNGSLP